MGAAECKIRLRAEFRARRDGISSRKRATLSDEIVRRICQQPEYVHADLIAAYVSSGGEVETRALIERVWADGKVVALPRCDAKTHGLNWYRADSFDCLVPGYGGILEPDPACTPKLDLACFNAPLAAVPGLAFDLQGMRLGYGGGFYDRFLMDFDGASFGLCCSALVCQSLSDLGAIDVFDRPVDAVITETATHRIASI